MHLAVTGMAVWVGWLTVDSESSIPMKGGAAIASVNGVENY
jgi:hypothetical protein